METLKRFFLNSAAKTSGMMAVAAAIVLIVVTFNWFIELSAFAVGVAKGVLGVFMVWVFDRYAMKELDTIEELKKGNIAYGLFMLGLFIVIAAAIINS